MTVKVTKCCWVGIAEIDGKEKPPTTQYTFEKLQTHFNGCDPNGWAFTVSQWELSKWVRTRRVFKEISYQLCQELMAHLRDYLAECFFSFGLWPRASFVWTTEKGKRRWWNCNPLNTFLAAALVKIWWGCETASMFSFPIILHAYLLRKFFPRKYICKFPL